MASTYGNAYRPRGSVARLSTRSTRGTGLHGSTYNNGPFGPALADDIFNLWDSDTTLAIEDISAHSEDESLPEWEEPYQLDLGLENQQQLEDQLRNEIQKFRRGYHKMMVFALQWHHLTQECEDNPQLFKMFQDIQMIRKLNGSEAV